ELSEAEAQFSGLRSQPKGRLLISAPVALGQYKIVPALPRLWEEYPDLRFEVDLDDRQIHIVEEGYDLAIRMSSSFEDSRLVSKRLGEQKLITCAAPAYLEKFGEPRKPEDLAYHRCIGFKFSGTNRIAPWRFQDRDKPYSVNPLGAFTFNNNSAMLDTARAAMGVTQLPAYVVEQDISSHRLRPVLDDYSPTPVDILALWPQTKHMAPKLRALIDFLYDLFNS
ncbi:MAG: substrate binding domain-containing protein, partial [Marinobacter sp.]|nr:substrate binding domain-containing protein [Marinobacter sp.]